MLEILNNVVTNDYFIMVVLVGVVFALVRVWDYVKIKYKISKEDVDFVINGITVGDSLLRKMGILDQENSKQVTRIIIDAIAFVKTLEFDSDSDKVESAFTYYKELVRDLDIQMDEEDDMLVRLTFEKILLK